MNFYRDLPTFEKFSELSDLSHFANCPRDWWIVLTDVAGSTQAIREGRYRDVNLVGVSSIVAVLNVAPKGCIPFVFGGDGATLLIPPELVNDVKEALIATRRMASQEFGLQLRIGIVPVAKVLDQGQQVLVGKWQVSPNYMQALFRGGGLTAAERILKGDASSWIETEPDSAAQANYSGLECRWSPITPQKGKVHCLIVSFRDSLSADTHNKTLQDILTEIKKIYPDADTGGSPFPQDRYRLTWNFAKLWGEVKIRFHAQSVFKRLSEWLHFSVYNVFGQRLVRDQVVTETQDWGKYVRELMANTDTKKFDDSLKMILSGPESSERDLRRVLEKLRLEKKIFYGVFVCGSAQMTCLVFSRHGDHIHFVDGSDGGYAMAAAELKAQIKTEID